MALTEQEIINTVYALYETDTTDWSTDDEEYLAARRYANVAISRWENYDNTEWKELWTKLSNAPDGDKTLTAGTYEYDCPNNFKRPSSYVRTLDASSNVTWWEVIPANKIATIQGSDKRYVYFTGNAKDGFVLNFNSKITLATGNTIEYEYYKTATLFTETTSTTEMADPYFIIYFIVARFLHNDGEDNIEELQESDTKLETMRVANMSGLNGIADEIEVTANNNFGLD